ncbi:MAG: PD-(D/E)XK nuclease family protein [Campylobacterota bacterium]
MSENLNYKIVEGFIFDDEIQDLLEQINNNMMDFNVLEITGMGTQEIRHSNLLSWMFGDNEHSLGYKIFDGFLKKVIEENEGNDFIEDLKHYVYLPNKEKNLTIFREKNNIDLLVVDEANKVVVAIENKVYASERSYGEDGGQLQKYFKYVNSSYNEKYTKFFIYLTIDNSYPSEENQDYWLVSSYQMIGEIIEQLLKNTSINNKTQLILSSYVDLLKGRNIMADKKLEEICEKIWAKNSKALDILYRYRKTDLDRLYDLLKEKFELVDDIGNKHLIKTKVHDAIMQKILKDSEQNAINFNLIKFKESIWFGYWHPNAKELIEKNKQFKAMYEKLFDKRVTKEHQRLRIKEDDFHNTNFEELAMKYEDKILKEIEKFETAVTEVLQK